MSRASMSGAHNDRSQSHRQWLAVTAPAGRAYAVERARAHLPPGAPLLPNEAGAEEGGRGRRREARRRPKKLRFISRGQKALAHMNGDSIFSIGICPWVFWSRL